MQKLKQFFISPVAPLCTGVVIFLASCSIQMSEAVLKQEAGFNGGFETVENNLPVNWLVYTPKTTGARFNISFDTLSKKEGKHALLLDVSECSDKGGRYSPGLTSEFPVNINEEYNIGFWLKKTETDFVITISGVNATEEWPGIKFLKTDSINKWQYFSFNYKIPQKVKFVKFEVNVLKPGKLWLDDVRIEKLK